MRAGFFIMVAITFDGLKSANVESDLVRSGGFHHVKIYRITLLCITVHFAKLCVWKLVLRSRIAERLIFATSNVTK
jgi:hypothetical protein